MHLRFFQRPLTSMYSTTSATQSFPSFFPPLDRDEDICEPFSLSLSSAEGRKAEGKEKRWNGMRYNSVAVVAAERTATRRLVIHRVQVRFYLVTVCTPAETRLPSFQIATNGPTIHIRGWAAPASVSPIRTTVQESRIYTYIYICNICIYIYSCIRGPANSHG